MSFTPKVRLYLDDQVAFGPGKARLLALIAETGSISAAARGMGMSYRRAWVLVETMNQCFAAPLVATAQRGKGGGGATINDNGRQVLALYEQVNSELQASDAVQALGALANPQTDP